MKAQANHVSAVITLCLLLSCQGLWAYGGGTGTRLDPYLIYTPEQMNEIGLYPEDWDKHFKLMADIDLAAYAPNQFNLIGLYRTSQDPNERLEVPFSGVFDGQGHTIANFTYEVAGDEDPVQGWVKGLGLFRLVDGESAEIRDLTLRDPNLYPSSTCLQRVGSIGVLTGVVKQGLITGCHIKGGRMCAEGSAGGLVGSARRRHVNGVLSPSTTISHCSTNCEVAPAPKRPFVEAERADFSLYSYMGGLLGSNSAMISHCQATGRVSGRQCVGGLAGYSSGDIMHCQATGQVSGESHVGGLVGESRHGSISSSLASGDVIGTNEESSEEPLAGVICLGGLVGSSLLNTVSDCCASGSITGESFVGGLVGHCFESRIERCYATGPAVVGNQQTGGLVGLTSLDTVISECYACTSVSVWWAGGGLVGLNGGTIQRSWTEGDVFGSSGVGGLVGEHWNWRMAVADDYIDYNGVMTDCYAIADVICEESRGGGLVGSNKGGMILRCFAAGEVIRSQDVGGLVGHENKEYPSEVRGSFWDTDVTGLSLSAKGTGLSSEQMQDRTAYIEAGWDLTDAPPTTPMTSGIWILMWTCIPRSSGRPIPVHSSSAV